MFKRFMVSLGLAVSLLLGGSQVVHAAQITPPPVPVGTKTTTLKGFPGIKGHPSIRPSGINQAKSLLTCSPACYYYNKGSQGTGGFATKSTGIYATLGWGAAGPSLNTGTEYHTLMEISAEKTVGGQRQIVEVGARDDGSGMKIFMYHWINGVGQGYNTNFTVSGTPTYAPGTAVGPGTALTASVKLWIEYISGNWWIGSHPTGGPFQWIGYYSGSLWTGATPSVTTFTDVDFPQAFGEIASTQATYTDVCSSMGSNTLATSTVGASWSSVTFPNLSSTLVNMTWTESPAGIHTYWNAEGLSARSARLGGPGKSGC